MGNRKGRWAPPTTRRGVPATEATGMPGPTADAARSPQRWEPGRLPTRGLTIVLAVAVAFAAGAVVNAVVLDGASPWWLLAGLLFLALGVVGALTALVGWVDIERAGVRHRNWHTTSEFPIGEWTPASFRHYVGTGYSRYRHAGIHFEPRSGRRHSINIAFLRRRDRRRFRIAVEDIYDTRLEPLPPCRSGLFRWVFRKLGKPLHDPDECWIDVARNE